MEKLRNTLQTDCWEAGGRQLPSYITALTASSADSGGKKKKGLGRELEKMSIEIGQRERKRKTEREGTARSEKQIKLVKKKRKERKEGDVRRKSRL